MPRINVEIEDDVLITVDEFFEEMDDEDVEEMKKLIGMESPVASNDFDNDVLKLLGNSWRLSVEDEATIRKIASKIIC
jgi:hypothetical protein